jgi:antitoxin (DNA-binding transcriptional repressor) of toxin-antitoxin stability system
MDISVTEFRTQCLELIRQVEITSHGKLVARLTPPSAISAQSPQPWRTMRGSGVLDAAQCRCGVQRLRSVRQLLVC